MAAPTASPSPIRPGSWPMRGTEPGAGDVVTPAPWLLTGRGLVIVLGARGHRGRRGLLGGLSAVAFVDYESSDVGPYRELLHVPRITRVADAVGPTVDHIWVTLHDSAVSGNVNWGLSKTVASIERASGDGGVERWVASDAGGPLARVEHRPFGPPLPVGKPAGLGRLLQHRGGRTFATPVGVRGLVRASRIAPGSLVLDAERIIALEERRVLGALSITAGTMTFGVPRID